LLLFFLLLVTRVAIKFFDKELIEGVLKAANRDEFTDHEKNWSHCSAKNTPQQVDHLKVSLACQHDTVEIR